LRGGWDLKGVLVGIHPLRKLDARAADPFGLELLREALGGPVARIVAVVGDEDVLGAVGLEGREVIVREAFDP
jgi:hypothetical protein